MHSSRSSTFSFCVATVCSDILEKSIFQMSHRRQFEEVLFCSGMTKALCTKWDPLRKGLLSLMWSTFSHPQAKPHQPNISVLMLLCLNGSKSLQLYCVYTVFRRAEWKLLGRTSTLLMHMLNAGLPAPRNMPNPKLTQNSPKKALKTCPVFPLCPIIVDSCGIPLKGCEINVFVCFILCSVLERSMHFRKMFYVLYMFTDKCLSSHGTL